MHYDVEFLDYIYEWLDYYIITLETFKRNSILLVVRYLCDNNLRRNVQGTLKIFFGKGDTLVNNTEVSLFLFEIQDWLFFMDLISINWISLCG